jgi:hypothetical protein
MLVFHIIIAWRSCRQCPVRISGAKVGKKIDIAKIVLNFFDLRLKNGGIVWSFQTPFLVLFGF